MIFMQMVSAIWKRLLIKHLLANARQNQHRQQNLPAEAQGLMTLRMIFRSRVCLELGVSKTINLMS